MQTSLINTGRPTTSLAVSFVLLKIMTLPPHELLENSIPPSAFSMVGPIPQHPQLKILHELLQKMVAPSKEEHRQEAYECTSRQMISR